MLSLKILTDDVIEQVLPNRYSKRVFYPNVFTVPKPGTTLHRQTNKFHSHCLSLANGDWDQSFPIPQEVKLEISHWLTVLNQWNGKEISLFPSYDYVLTTDASESGAGATLKRGNKVIKTWSFRWSSTQSNMSSNRGEMLALLMGYQALSRWSDTRAISSVQKTLETMPQEESQLDWRAYSRILQCKS
ncbi:hypothetical protein ACTFIZ_007906 [Dictyostelium cf. discoideum]